jgi:uncharacterized membrane protein HdeD (DUF308 family)
MFVTNPFSPGTWTRDQLNRISSGWWVLLVSGLITVVAGGIILFTDWTVSDLIVFVGALLVIRGFFTLFSIPLDGTMRTWSVVYGLIEIGVGIAVFVWPDPTLLVLAAFIGWLLLFRGIVTVAGSITGRQFIPYWGLLLALGIFEVVVSFWLLARPGLTLVAAVMAIGLVCVFYGAAMIMFAFELKRLPSNAEKAVDRFNGSMPTRVLDSAVH